MKSNRKTGTQFAVCIDNKGYAASLEPRKIYRVVPDASAAVNHQIRIIDESGEDYLYPKEYFVPIALPHALEEALLHAS